MRLYFQLYQDYREGLYFREVRCYQVPPLVPSILEVQFALSGQVLLELQWVRLVLEVLLLLEVLEVQDSLESQKLLEDPSALEVLVFRSLLSALKVQFGRGHLELPELH